VNRDSLIWFALGAACSSLAAVVAFVIHQQSTKQLQFNLVIAGEIAVMPTDSTALQIRKFERAPRLKAVEIARECKMTSFDAIIHNDHGDGMSVPLTADTPTECAIEKARKQNLWVGLEFEESN
jgi:hypothetical protein